MGNEQGIFRDTRERSTKALLRDALLSGKTLTLREVNWALEERRGWQIEKHRRLQFYD